MSTNEKIASIGEGFTVFLQESNSCLIWFNKF